MTRETIVLRLAGIGALAIAVTAIAKYLSIVLS